MSRGVLLCAYNCADTLKDCLAPWIELKKELGFIISCVSVPFVEYRDMAMPADETRRLLDDYLARGDIDFLITHPPFLGEAAARNLALRPLLASEVSTVHLLDADEVMDVKEIRAAYKYVDRMEDVCWFSTHFRNYVGDGRGYVEGFCPPRIFRTECGNLSFQQFFWDNDGEYIRDDGEVFSYKNLPQAVIPKAVYHPKHYTWMNNERSRLKILYQKAHFGGVCSYRWNNGKVEFDPEYYRKVGQPIPEVIHEQDND